MPSQLQLLHVALSSVPSRNNLTWKSVENYPAQTHYDDICNYKPSWDPAVVLFHISSQRFILHPARGICSPGLGWETRPGGVLRTEGVLVLVDRIQLPGEGGMTVRWAEHSTIISLHHHTTTTPRDGFHSFRAKQKKRHPGLVLALSRTSPQRENRWCIEKLDVRG